MTQSVLREAAVISVGAVALLAFGAGGMAATGGGPAPLLSPGPAVAGVSTPHLAFPDAPPARVTGGFGEDSCFACHWDGEENDGVGLFEISGFPEEFEPGADYLLEIALSHPLMEVAGFQLAIRRVEGAAQAGELGLFDRDEGRVAILLDRDVQFAHQTSAGNEISEEGPTRWSLRWTAPEADAGELRLHASGVAGDGDRSQMGDAVYTLRLESRPEGRR